MLQFWDARMRFERLRASSTDKTQGITIGGFSDEVTSTNLAEVIKGAVEGAVKGMKEIP